MSEFWRRHSRKRDWRAGAAALSLSRERVSVSVWESGVMEEDSSERMVESRLFVLDGPEETPRRDTH